MDYSHGVTVHQLRLKGMVITLQTNQSERLLAVKKSLFNYNLDNHYYIVFVGDKRNFSKARILQAGTCFKDLLEVDVVNVVNWARVLCLAGCKDFVEYKTELEAAESLTRFTAEFKEMSARMWKKAVIDSSAATRQHHKIVVSDVTEQNLHPAQKNVDSRSSVCSGAVQHIFSTNTMSNSRSSVPAVLKDLCKLVDEDSIDDLSNSDQFNKTYTDISKPKPRNFSKRFTFKIHGEGLDEYHDMDGILTGLFPFIFHQGYNRRQRLNGPLNLRERSRLFLYHDMVAAENSTLLTFVFDCMRRKECMRGASFKTKRNYNSVHEALTKFKNFLSSCPANADLCTAQYAKPLARQMKSLRRVINLFSPPVFWGPFERHRNISKFYAMGQFFGSSSIFMTISPCMMDNFQCLELCITAAEKDKVCIPIDRYLQGLVLGDRRLLIAKNPIAQAVAFHKIITTVFKELLKVQLIGTGSRSGTKRWLTTGENG